jgi:hypothetical protein
MDSASLVPEPAEGHRQFHGKAGNFNKSFDYMFHI